jgi:hypothetical protein
VWVDPAAYGKAKTPIVLHTGLSVHGRLGLRYAKIDTDLGDALHRPRNPTCLRIHHTGPSDASGVALNYGQ